MASIPEKDATDSQEEEFDEEEAEGEETQEAMQQGLQVDQPSQAESADANPHAPTNPMGVATTVTTGGGSSSSPQQVMSPNMHGEQHGMLQRRTLMTAATSIAARDQASALQEAAEIIDSETGILIQDPQDPRNHTDVPIAKTREILELKEDLRVLRKGKLSTIEIPFTGKADDWKD